jgi:CheY-like chemotaxis protein
MPVALVVDDSEMDRLLAGRLLQEAGDIQVEYAEDGQAALERIATSEPDVVVADLLMPRMDGLELVTHLHMKHPRVPVILMTAHGSETVAAQALERGAASYVPKSQLADRLVETVRDILALSRADRTYERLIECSTRSQFEFRLYNDPGLIDPLVDLVQQMVSSMGVCQPPEQLQVGVAVEQALLNAMLHGNLELTAAEVRLPRPQREVVVRERQGRAPYRDRRVFVHISITPQEAKFVIRDDGPGFDVKSVISGGTLDQESQRGLVLMRAFMDDVRFNDRGNEVVMTKRRKANP